MKLTVPMPVVLPVGLPNLTGVISISFADRSYTERHFNFFQTIFDSQGATPRRRPVYNFKRIHLNNIIGMVQTLQPDGSNHNTTNYVPEFADDTTSSSPIAGRRIFFRTQSPKTSVELPSLTTGPCSVRVKNKATGQATLLLSVKI